MQTNDNSLIEKTDITRINRITYDIQKLQEFIDDKDLCKMINVSPVTFSRQINSNRFDSAFLHKYLIASQVIPESVTMPIYDRLKAFISAYPIEYQKSIKSFFTKS